MQRLKKNHHLKIAVIVALELVIIGIFGYNLFFHPAKKVVPTYISSGTKGNAEGRYKFFYETSPEIHPIKPTWLPKEPVSTYNSDKLHERFDYPVKKEEGTFRILTLGDSFTFGLFVDTKDNWTEQLEDILATCRGKRVEVINLAVGGYDLQYEVERFKRRGEKYKADLVIWFLHSSDYEQIIEELKTRASKNLDSMGKEGKDIKDHAIILKAWEDAQAEFSKEFPESTLLEKHRETIQDLSSVYNGELLFTWHDSKYLPFPEKFSLLVREIARERGNTQVFTGIRDTYKEGMLKDAHLNPKGHRMVAEDIAGFVRNSYLPTCN